MHYKVMLVGFVLVAMFSPSLSSAAGLNPGQIAPEFNLPTFGGKELISSSTFLLNQPFTMLVFWNSECEECLKALKKCDSLADSAGSMGVQLLGVNHDTDRINSARDFLRRNEISFVQVSDIDKQVASSFGAEPFSFSLVLLDSTGLALGVFYDRPPDLEETFWGMVAAARKQGKGRLGPTRETGLPEIAKAGASKERETPVPPTGMVTPRESGAGREEPDAFATSAITPGEMSGISMSGRLMERLMEVQVLQRPLHVAAPTGPYGEALEKGRYLTHRFELEFRARIAGSLRAAALLRLSNEDEHMLQLGPQYFASTLGSVYVQYSSRQFQARLGYFDAYFTPLSLMRWDSSDNPKSGGSTGSCACAGAAGALLSGTLEELGPTLTFEGLDVSWPFAPYANVRAFYAVPRNAYEVSTTDYYLGRETLEDFRYRRDLYGVRGGFGPGHFLGRLSPALSLHSVIARDDGESATLPAPGLEPLVPAVQNQVYGGTVTFPLHRRLTIQAEFDRSRTDHDVRESSDIVTWGSGFLASIGTELAEWLRSSLAYFQASENFSSAYSALSYEPNRKGPRGSVSFMKEWLNVELFAKHLMPVEEESQIIPGGTAHRVLQNELILGVWASRSLPRSLDVGSGWVLEREAHDSRPVAATQPSYVRLGSGLRVQSNVLTVRITRDFGRQNRVELLHQHIKHSDGVDGRNDYSAHRTSLQFSLRF
ncbi:MAG: TlpA disulfide reductase family protein [Candidatus Eisenbacteria bacterium]|nr:TlpA disulfide reductase family protein [Candidatus Eisenbacteria bacterium]